MDSNDTKTPFTKISKLSTPCAPLVLMPVRNNRDSVKVRDMKLYSALTPPSSSRIISVPTEKNLTVLRPGLASTR